MENSNWHLSHGSLYSLSLNVRSEHCSAWSRRHRLHCLNNQVCQIMETCAAEGGNNFPPKLWILLFFMESCIFIHSGFYHLHPRKVSDSYLHSAHLISTAFHKLHIWGDVYKPWDLTYFQNTSYVASNTCTVSFRSDTRSDKEVALRCHWITPEKQRDNLSRWLLFAENCFSL